MTLITRSILDAFQQIRLDRTEAYKRTAIDHFPFLANMELSEKFWELASGLTVVVASDSPVLRGSTVDFLMAMNRECTFAYANDNDRALKALLVELGFDKRLRDPENMTRTELEDTVKRYRNGVRAYMGGDEGLLDFEMSDATMKEKSKIYLVMTFDDVHPSAVKTHAVTSNKEDAERVFDYIRKEATNVVNMIEVKEDFVCRQGLYTMGNADDETIMNIVRTHDISDP
jgi:hypothetical protein